MSLHVRRLLERSTIRPGDAVDLSLALDLGEYRELHLVMSVESAGEGADARLCVRHAAVNEEAHYVDFETPAEIPLDQTGTLWFHADSFTRWVCWFVSGTLTGEATVTLDLVAKG